MATLSAQPWLNEQRPVDRWGVLRPALGDDQNGKEYWKDRGVQLLRPHFLRRSWRLLQRREMTPGGFSHWGTSFSLAVFPTYFTYITPASI